MFSQNDKLFSYLEAAAKTHPRKMKIELNGIAWGITNTIYIYDRFCFVAQFRMYSFQFTIIHFLSPLRYEYTKFPHSCIHVMESGRQEWIVTHHRLVFPVHLVNKLVRLVAGHLVEVGRVLCTRCDKYRYQYGPHNGTVYISGSEFLHCIVLSERCGLVCRIHHRTKARVMQSYHVVNVAGPQWFVNA